MGKTDRQASKILSPSHGPRVVVGGVVVREGDRQARPDKAVKAGPARPRTPFALGLVSAIGALVVLVAGLLGSCAGTASLSLRGDGSLRVQVESTVPSILAARLRSLSGLAGGAPLFNAEAARKAAASHEGLKLSSFATTGPDSLSAVMDIADFKAFLAEPRLAATHAATLSSGDGWKELRVRLERGNCGPLIDLLPGLDPELLDALSPPALDPEPISRAEYRRALAGIVGEKAVASVEAANLVLRIAAPGAVLSSTGGKLEGQTLVVSLPALDLLVLEKPIEFSLRWKA